MGARGASSPGTRPVVRGCSSGPRGGSGGEEPGLVPRQHRRGFPSASFAVGTEGGVFSVLGLCHMEERCPEGAWGPAAGWLWQGVEAGGEGHWASWGLLPPLHLDVPDVRPVKNKQRRKKIRVSLCGALGMETVPSAVLPVQCSSQTFP